MIIIGEKTVIAYKQIFRSFFNCKRGGTTLQMLEHDLQPYEVIERKCLHGFRERVLKCDNEIVHSIVNASCFNSTNFTVHCYKIVYA